MDDIDQTILTSHITALDERTAAMLARMSFKGFYVRHFRHNSPERRWKLMKDGREIRAGLSLIDVLIWLEREYDYEMRAER